MGLTNHGTQTITYQYFIEATGANFGKRALGIIPTGIYSGGYLTRVSDSVVTLSTLIAEIRDATNQISVRTATSATLSAATLDSGAIASATPYIVLRWVYASSSVNYFEVHALASLAAAGTYDIVIGKCNFTGSVLTGFSYTDRTFLNVQNLFLRVEASTGLYVQVRAGKVQTATGYVKVSEQTVGPFVLPGSPNSRIDLVYITDAGAVDIFQGTPAVSPVAPAYAGKLVIAEVTVVNGDISIPASRITDVRSFITPITPTLTIVNDYIKVSDRTASGVGPQANASNTWTTKRINTEDNDSDGHCSIGSNRITLAAGTYRCRIYSPVYVNCLSHKARLRNITNNTTTLVGTSSRQHDNYSRGTDFSEIVGEFTITTTTVFEIQHYKKGGSGWGYQASVGEPEVYTTAEFWKVA